MRGAVPFTASARPPPGRHHRRVGLFGIEQREHPFGRRHGLLHHRVLRGEIANGGEELAQVFDEGDQHAEGQGAGGDAHAAVPQQPRHRDRADGLDDGVERGVGGDGPRVGPPVVAVDGVELGGDLAFLGEGLDDLHARQVLLQEGVHARQLHANLAKRVAHPAPEIAGDSEQHRRRAH